MKVEILHLEAASDLRALQLRHNDYGKLLEEKARQVKQVVVEFMEAREKGRSLNRKAKQIMDQIKERPGGQEASETMNSPDYDMNQFNADLDSERARLELTHGGSSNMIKEFEERERQIEKLREKLSEFYSKLADIQESIDEVRGAWEPRLDALISKISDAFSDSFQRIGCAGQVSLDKVEAEPGPNGEAGGTIFYLMALQSLSASPFRVVDEINQGMDPRNERMVHGRLVDIACASDDEASDEDGNPVGGGGGGQYFLITPKLLSGLAYKRGMRVLCIYSGEHMPQDYGKLKFDRAISKMKAIAAQRSSGNSNTPPIEIQNQVDIYA